MAYTHEKYCDTCNHFTTHTNNKCDHCVVEKAIKNIEEWKKLSIDEKIDNLNKRIIELERRNQL